VFYTSLVQTEGDDLSDGMVNWRSPAIMGLEWCFSVWINNVCTDNCLMWIRMKCGVYTTASSSKIHIWKLMSLWSIWKEFQLGTSTRMHAACIRWYAGCISSYTGI